MRPGIVGIPCDVTHVRASLSRPFAAGITATLGLLIALTAPGVANAQMIIRVGDQDQPVDDITALDGHPLLATDKGAYVILGGNISEYRVVAIGSTDYRVSRIESTDGAVWLFTGYGVCVVRKNPGANYQAVWVKGASSDVSGVACVGGCVWLTGGSLPSERTALYYARAEATGGYSAREVSLPDMPSPKMTAASAPLPPERVILKEACGQAWLIGEGAAYVVTPDETGSYRLTRAGDPRTHVSDVREADGHTWLLTRQGAYVVHKDEAEKYVTTLVGPGEEATGVTEAGHRLWLTTALNVYVIDGKEPKDYVVTRVKIQDDFTYCQARRVGERVWLNTPRVNYIVQDDAHGSYEAKQVEKLYEVSRIKQIGSDTWIIGRDGSSNGNMAYVLANGSTTPKPVTCEGFGGIRLVTDVFDLGGQTWLTASAGLYRRKPGTQTAERVIAVTGSSLDIEDTGGQLWLIVADSAGAGGAAYLIQRSGETYTAVRAADASLGVRKVRNIGGRTWLATQAGTYVVEPDARISVVLENGHSSGQWLVDTIVRRLGVYASGYKPLRAFYVRTSDQSPMNIPFSADEATIFLSVESTARDGSEPSKGYSTFRGATESLTPGTHYRKYYRIRDKWGNTSDGSIDAYVAPSAAALSVLIPMAWAALLLVALVLAPYVRWCHMLLMNPSMRKYGSFGLVPLLLSVFPPVRRHVMRRYRRSVAKEFGEWEKRFVVPEPQFIPEKFGGTLVDKRSVLLHGKSGLGKTSYFMYLSWFYASHGHPRPLSKNTLPVFMPLKSYAGCEPSEIFQRQLEKHGSLTDRDLTEWLLKQGDFVLFFDGLNEIAEEARKCLPAFIDTYRTANYVCISSQHYYDEFKTVATRIDLEGFSPDKVREMLTKRFGEEGSKEIAGRFTDEMYAMCSVPQQLEFVIDMLKKDPNHPLPQTQQDLYRAILAPVLAKWQDEGRMSYADLLFRRAFTMVAIHTPFFDSEEIPDEIRDDLLDEKLIVKSGDHLQCRHDLVKAYLASQHFAPNWRHLLCEGDTCVDVDWLTMLELSVPQLDSEGARGLLFAILDKDAEIAAKLFTRVNAAHADLCRDWADKFYHAYGEKKLR